MNPELNNKIKETAYQMFRDWTKNAKSKHPEFDFAIIDETILVNDLTNCIKSAIYSLKNEEKKSDRDIPGYDIGFIWGFINTSLNGQWVHEYIRKRSDDYKMLMTLKALQLYLDIDDIAVIKIDEIYKKIFIEDVNFENICFKPDKKQFKNFGPALKNININANRNNNISISLNNLITEKIAKIVSEKDRRFLPKTEIYLTKEDVNLLISVF
jgi:hypothetical protein